ncbi:phosphopantetheine-binding protein [Dictyobacter formicarum]|uniref:Carrier domain-containing protein n=1 Tax=Dictyobacter formicarum TaxID=2778368 RepID=A0ABQ3V980_9CHLR|nr:phosphopantetheine-binding protein [Dictyobacter formicarum]GHO82447.1 hypothetical protein KSZ_04530 [Dictyobacter formicarum]
MDINAVVPRDILEFQLLQIWEETLQVRPILINDSFFALGGHSILAVSLMAKIRQRLGIDLPLAILFEHRTIAELAVVVRQQCIRRELWKKLLVAMTLLSAALA